METSRLPSIVPSCRLFRGGHGDQSVHYRRWSPRSLNGCLTGYQWSRAYALSGYSGFNELYGRGKIHEAACRDHTRRYVYEVHDRTPTEATRQVPEWIGELYGVEADIRGKPVGERRRVPQEKSVLLLAAIKMWMTDKLATLSKKSELAKAIRYSLNQWDALVLYCEVGNAEISNALAENALRCVSLGRENFLFAGSDSGGERAAAMYGLIGTCKLNGINPRTYLEYVPTHIAGHPINRIDERLPWNVARKLRRQVAPPASTD
ncbi:transposase [Burkholderia sp. LMG 13014]|uniref:IS66 family transposase n=1 Tax=Burkholderia TaxID=32008 RepID=UPI0035A9A9D6